MTENPSGVTAPPPGPRLPGNPPAPHRAEFKNRAEFSGAAITLAGGGGRGPAMPGGAGPGPGRAARAPRAFLAVVDNSAGALWAGGAGGAGGPGARLGRQVRAIVKGQTKCFECDPPAPPKVLPY